MAVLLVPSCERGHVHGRVDGSVPTAGHIVRPVQLPVIGDAPVLPPVQADVGRVVAWTHQSGGTPDRPT